MYWGKTSKGNRITSRSSDGHRPSVRCRRSPTERSAAPVRVNSMLPRSARVELNQTWRRGELVPVVGAGVSMSSGLPSWAGLLERLVEHLASEGLLSEALELRADELLRAFVVQRSSEMPPIVIARYLRAMAGDSRSFAYKVYNALYADFYDEPQPSELVLSL